MMLGIRAVGLRYAPLTPRLIQRSAIRCIKTESLTFKDAQSILNKQRLHRPSSPHFTIYKPQIPWILSIATRVTGAGLSVGLYGFFLAYLVSPVFGWHLDTAHIVDFVHQMPDWVKYAGKTIVAAPFAFHSLNGLRHLVWDTTKGLSNRAVIRGGWAVVGGTVISTIALVLL